MYAVCMYLLILTEECVEAWCGWKCECEHIRWCFCVRFLFLSSFLVYICLAGFVSISTKSWYIIKDMHDTIIYMEKQIFSGVFQ